MNENNIRVPKHWILINLEEILSTIESGGRPKGGVRNIKEGIPSIGGEHLSNNGGFDFSNLRYIPKNFFENMKRGKIKKFDVLVVKDGATTGKTSFVSDSFPFKEAAVNEHVFILRTNDRVTLPKYLFFWMLSPFGQNSVKDNFQGTAQGGINTLFVKNSIIPIPPLSEQHRIVAKIEELFTKLDAGVDALKKAKEQIKRYRQAVLKYAFEGKLTEEWRKTNRDKLESASVLLERIKEERKKKLGKKYKELPPIDTSELPELPEEWMWVRLGDVCDIIRGISFPKEAKVKYYRDKYLPCLRTANVQTEVDWNDLWFIPNNFVKSEDKIIKHKDILISNANSLELVGKVSLVKYLPYKEVTFGAFISVIRVNENLNKDFIYYQLKSDAVQSKIRSIASTTTNISNVNTSKLINIEILLPPLAEQQQIVEEIERRFSVADEVEKVIDNSLKQAERLRQSILKKAFEGKLVPQDPSDEPTEKILERIKAEKENNEKRNRKS